MAWIEGIAQTPHGFVLETINENGFENQESLATLSSKFTNRKTSRKRLTTDCQTWSAVSAEPFWRFLGIAASKPRDKHSVFKMEHEETEYLIPASVVIAAMLRPIKHIFPYLFRPHGLEQISIPLFDASRPSVGFYIPVHRVVGNTRTLTDGLHAGLSWMHCFPSAREMWDSVYHSALTGKLNINLPKASMTTVLHSIAWKNTQLVTEMTITKIWANEAPFEFAKGHAAEFVLHESATTGWVVASRSKPNLTKLCNMSSLSDEEWEQLAPRMIKMNSTKHDLRSIIDLILLKLKTGTPWTNLDFRGLNRPIVVYTYQGMLRDGRWEYLENTLHTTRNAYAL